MIGPSDIKSRELIIGDKSKRFDHQIAEHLVHNDLIILRFHVPADSTFDRNIVAVDGEGTIAWRVEEPSRPPADDANPFVSVYKRGEQLWGHCYWGPEYRTDPDTGNLLERRDMK